MTALVKKILRNTPREVIVKWTGTGTDTLTLASLVAPNQTVVDTATANIVAASISGAGLTTVSRNGQVAIFATGNFELRSDDDMNVTLNENATFDIIVTTPSDSTVILKLRKTYGYSEVNFI